MYMALLIIGGLAALIGGLWIVVNAFRTGILWGLGSLLIPLVVYIYAFMNWGENKTPFLVHLVGVILYLVGSFMLAGSMGTIE